VPPSPPCEAPFGRAAASDFPGQLAELFRLLDDGFASGHAYANVDAVPGPVQGASPGGVQSPHRPPLWLFGSSGDSARLAAMLGPPFAHHISPQNTVQSLDVYRRAFQPSVVLAEPYALPRVSALATDDGRGSPPPGSRECSVQAAAALGMSRPVPVPGRGRCPEFSTEEGEFVDSWTAGVPHGTLDEVRSRLSVLVQNTGADEWMLVCRAHRGDLRLRSYELIADAFGLPSD
jgi:alkanesulfonate monooxygenase SsuD/methylene tetrahydromethanopterin reductase-like flavin-dependent oxidoreductase (luciferase family)